MAANLNICRYQSVKICDEYGINRRFNLLFQEVCALKNSIIDQCGTNIDSTTGNTGEPQGNISLLMDDGTSPTPWRGTWDEFLSYLGANASFIPSGITTFGAGGISTGTDLGTTPITLQELGDRIFYAYVAPIISLSSPTATTLREFGNTISTITLNGLTTKNSENITEVTFFRNGGLIHTQSSPTPTGGTESYTNTTPITTNTNFQAKVEDGTTLVNSNTLNYNFVYPYIFGSDVPAKSFASMYTDFTKAVESQGNKTKSFSPSTQVMYFGYPATYPDLTIIYDQNGFDVTADWTKRTGTITGLDGTPQSYKVYEFENLTSFTNLAYQFI